jgi:hypothetical protein
MRRCATWSPGPPGVRKTTAGRARRSISGCAGTSMESWMCGSAPVDHGQRCSGRIRGAGPRIAPSVKVWGASIREARVRCRRGTEVRTDLEIRKRWR